MSLKHHKQISSRPAAQAYRCMQAVTSIFLISLFAGCTLGSLIGPQGQGTPVATRKPAASTRQLDPREANRLQGIMTPLIQHMNKPLPLNEVKISILDNSQINAGNAGGGKFFVTTGLLEKGNDDELRGVMAHEIAHADLGHVAKAQLVGVGLDIGIIVLDKFFPGSSKITPLVADLGVMRPFSRKEEYEADAHGVEILKRSGYNGKQIEINTLTWLLKTDGPSGGFLETHPDTEARIQQIRNLP